MGSELPMTLPLSIGTGQIADASGHGAHWSGRGAGLRANQSPSYRSVHWGRSLMRAGKWLTRSSPSDCPRYEGARS